MTINSESTIIIFGESIKKDIQIKFNTNSNNISNGDSKYKNKTNFENKDINKKMIESKFIKLLLLIFK